MAGEERYRGSITAGKVADLTVLGQNTFAIEPMETLNTEVGLTVLRGQIVCGVPRFLRGRKG